MSDWKSSKMFGSFIDVLQDPERVATLQEGLVRAKLGWLVKSRFISDFVEDFFPPSPNPFINVH